eukprot:COSAG01_NODE_60169_length_296_cov_0.756345_1_plen_43_part_10
MLGREIFDTGVYYTKSINMCRDSFVIGTALSLLLSQEVEQGQG